MKKYLSVALTTLTLSSCLSYQQQLNTMESETISGTQKQPKQTYYKVTPNVSIIHDFNWISSLQLLVTQMLEAKVATAGSLLLIDSIRNNTNSTFRTEQVTSALHAVLKPNSTFIVVPETELKNTKKALGLSSKDSFGSRSKAIGLARIINAQYVLYNYFSGDIKLPILNMQLILVQTGEIIWSGHKLLILK